MTTTPRREWALMVSKRRVAEIHVCVIWAISPSFSSMNGRLHPGDVKSVYFLGLFSPPISIIFRFFIFLSNLTVIPGFFIEITTEIASFYPPCFILRRRIFDPIFEAFKTNSQHELFLRMGRDGGRGKGLGLGSESGPGTGSRQVSGKVRGRGRVEVGLWVGVRSRLGEGWRKILPSKTYAVIWWVGWGLPA